MHKNKLIKLFIPIGVVLLLVFVSIVKIIQSKSNPKVDNIEPSVISILPGFTFAHIEVIAEDERDLFYYYNKNNVGFEDAEIFPMKLLTFEIKELFIHDSFKLRVNDPIYKEGDTIQIAFALSLYEQVIDYNEFIIDIDSILKEDLFTINRNDYISDVYLLLPSYNQEKQVTLDNLILPVSDDEIHFHNLNNHQLLTSHFLMYGNVYVDDTNYQFKEGISIPSLRQYFKIVLSKMNELETKN